MLLRKMERIRIRKLKRSDFAEYYKNELQYYRELKKDPTFGIGTYGKRLTKKHRRIFLKAS